MNKISLNNNYIHLSTVYLKSTSGSVLGKYLSTIDFQIKNMVSITLVNIEFLYQSLYSEARTVALNISKAFDNVLHAGFFHNLQFYGVCGRIILRMKSFIKR